MIKYHPIDPGSVHRGATTSYCRSMTLGRRRSKQRSAPTFLRLLFCTYFDCCDLASAYLRIKDQGWERQGVWV